MLASKVDTNTQQKMENQMNKSTDQIHWNNDANTSCLVAETSGNEE